MKTLPRAASLLLAAGIFACGGVSALSTAAFAADSQTIQVSMFAFAPGAITVSAGTKVTWTNLDEEPHTVFSLTRAFQSDALDTGQSFSFVFDKPGTYKYVCSIHPHMKGVVVVTPGGGN